MDNHLLGPFSCARLTLAELFAGFEFPDAYASLIPNDLHLDSRQVVSGGVFFARQGSSVDRRAFVQSAFSKGALAVVLESDRDHVELGSGGLLIYAKELSTLMGRVADRFFGEASEAIVLVGITGTNGKTSCSDLMLQLWHASSVRAASIGTLGWKLAGGEFHATGLTTLDVIENNRLLSRMVKFGITHVVMEVSSHGIDQGRISGLRFNARALSNISRDHLDYHGSMDSYAETKLSFVDVADTQVVVNLDDTRVAKAIAKGRLAHARTFSRKNTRADLFAGDVSYLENGMALNIAYTGEVKQSWQLNLMGEFNLENVMLVYLLSRALGLSVSEQQLKDLRPVTGRLQKVACQKNIYVDYAHTPDALEKVLETLAMHFNNDLAVLFGCGGDRDKGKRSQMAAIAQRYAKKIFVTSDNPRTEDPKKIIDDICVGFNSMQGVTVEVDRAAAIKYAIESISDEVLLIAGKGHEDYQEINGVRYEFSDYEQVLRCVA